MGTVEYRRTLQQLGLDDYLQRFQDNQIDDDSFLLLSQSDLRELVPALRHRTKLWNSIQNIKSGSVYACFSCSDTFLSLIQLVNHLKFKHKFRAESTYKCCHCEGLFQRRSYFNYFRNIFKVHPNLHSGLLTSNGLDPLETRGNCYDNADVDSVLVDNVNNPKNIACDLKLLASKLIASILQSGKIPMSTCDSIIAQVKQLLSEIVDIARNLSADIVRSENTTIVQLKALEKLNFLKNPFQDIDTKYKLDKYLLKNNFLINPKEIVLDSDISFRSEKSVRKQVYKPITMQYISIKESLIQLLNKPGLFQSLNCSKSFNGELYSSFRDGLFCKNEAWPKNVLFINIYYDDAEMANPLGSKSGKHKLGNFYFAVQDMPVHMISSTDNIILLASLKSEDMKLASANAVMQVIVDELLELWNTGIDFIVDGNRMNIKVILSQFSGDNLSLYSIFGYSEGFTANWPCRRCKMHKFECQKAIVEDESKLRNLQNYNSDLQLNCFSQTGINFESVINKLPYHHVTKMVVFDIMHDVFEGVGPDLIVNILNFCIQKKYFTLDKLNYRLESFNYGRHYNKSKPSIIKPSFLKGESKAGQSASQSICLILCLPLIIGDLVPCNSDRWQLFLLFREIVDLLLSPLISQGGIVYLDGLISEFCFSYQKLFDRNLKPKHHHLLHYARSIELIGPLLYFWSMTFEAKHKFFKTTAHMICNFRNIAKSVAYRHQLSRCFKLLTKEEFRICDFLVPSYEMQYLVEFEYRQLVIDRFDFVEDMWIKTTQCVSYNGCEYRIGSILLTSLTENRPMFGRIVSIILESDECNIIVSEMEGEYEPHLASYKLNVDDQMLRLIDINSIFFYLPLYEMQSFKLNDVNSYITLPMKYNIAEATNPYLNNPIRIVEESETSSFTSDDIFDETFIRGMGININPSILKSNKNQPRGSIDTPRRRNLQREPVRPIESHFNQRDETAGLDLQRELDVTHISVAENGSLTATQSNVNNSNAPKPSESSSKPVSDTPIIYGFDIEKVLVQSEVVKKIIDVKLQNDELFILRSDRQAIAAVLIDAIILHLGDRPSKAALEQLARHLVIKYSNFGDPRRQEKGFEMWFFQTPFGPCATGFLEERLKNQRKRLQSKKIPEKLVGDQRPLLDWKSDHEDDDPEPDTKVMTFMKHNFGADVQTKMKETVLERRTFIRRLRKTMDTGISRVMEYMPRLFDTEGMIVQDFNVRHPGLAYVIYSQWPVVSKSILEYAEQSGVNYMKKLDVAKKPKDLIEVDIQILAFCLLPFVLPSCARKATTQGDTPSLETTGSISTETPVRNKRKCPSIDASRRKLLKTVKASDLDCLKSLILFKPKNTHIAEVLQENKRRSPFILALGTPLTLEFEEFFIVIHKVAIPCGSQFLVALDTCFKSFTVLSLPFPLESYDHWIFISNGIAGMHLDQVIPPVVQALIGQIMAKSF